MIIFLLRYPRPADRSRDPDNVRWRRGDGEWVRDGQGASHLRDLEERYSSNRR